jgi:uncharacterized Ntn-hydrolase superfamily protein
MSGDKNMQLWANPSLKCVRLLSPRLVALSVIFITAPLSVAHATWSVVAVDPVTGQVGAAGATCFPDTGTIAGIVPGKGVVVAQGLTSYPGRDFAIGMLQEGSSAGEVIDMVRTSKADDSFFVIRQFRQYGVASLHEGEASVASYTGMFTQGARGSREAAGVSVQGNILESREVLDKTLEHYVSTPKSCGMAVALLNALEAGSREGGDSRCSAEQSALSAFLMVAEPDDSADALTIRLVAPIQQPGEGNPVLMLRQQLRDHFAEQSIVLEECAL